MKKIGIYGGSFDPVHKGHRLLAENLSKEINADKVFIIPAAVSPFKKGSVASDEDRLAMCTLAFSDIYKVENLFDADEFKTWIPADNDKEPELTITLSQKDMFDKIVMQEHIINGQHIEGYEVYIDKGAGKFKKVAEGEVVGYKRIVKITPTEATRVKIKITSYRGKLEMENVTLY